MTEATIIWPDGSEDRLEDNSGLPITIDAVRSAIRAETLATFRLRDGRTVWVNDEGHALNLPFNEKATKLYHSICKPGTRHVIVGAVVVTRGDA